jgi:hypothetical protein
MRIHTPALSLWWPGDTLAELLVRVPGEASKQMVIVPSGIVLRRLSVPERKGMLNPDWVVRYDEFLKLNSAEAANKGCRSPRAAKRYHSRVSGLSHSWRPSYRGNRMDVSWT